MISDVRSILTDTDHSISDRLYRLQGWRGADLDRARAAGWATRIAPATCFLGTAAAAVFQSPLILAILVAGAVVGAFASNHPAESVYQAWARRTGRPVLPAARAARRSGCAIGAVQLTVAAVAFAAGATGLGLFLTLFITVAAGVFTLTGFCLPSFMFTTQFGRDRGASPTLQAAMRCRSAQQPTAA